MESIHEGIRYTCSSCFKKFTRVSYLKHHERTGNCRLKLGDSEIVSIIPLRDYKVNQESSLFSSATNPFTTMKVTNSTKKTHVDSKPSHTQVRPTSQITPIINKMKREIDNGYLSDSSQEECCVVRIPPKQRVISGSNQASTSSYVPPTVQRSMPIWPNTSTSHQIADDPYIDLTTPNLSPQGSTPCLGDSDSSESIVSGSTINYGRTISPNPSDISWDQWAEQMETNFLDDPVSSTNSSPYQSDWSSVRDDKWATPTPIPSDTDLFGTPSLPATPDRERGLSPNLNYDLRLSDSSVTDPEEDIGRPQQTRQTA